MGKTYVIDGVTYVVGDRTAVVGDLVLVFNTDICEVIDGWAVGNDFVYKLKRPCGKELQSWFDGEDLRVLEPLATEEPTVDTSQASPEVIDMLANLARRVTQLESQLRDTQGNVERLSEESENNRHAIISVNLLAESNEQDIAMLDERTFVLNAINKYYAEGSR